MITKSKNPEKPGETDYTIAFTPKELTVIAAVIAVGIIALIAVKSKRLNKRTED